MKSLFYSQPLCAKSNTHRRGFTITELLVAIAIIGILIALLLPAIQATREAGRRVHCQNNLKQLALACHSYESSYKVLPGYAGEEAIALVHFPKNQVEKKLRGFNWLARALMFAEQNNYADSWGTLGAAEGGLDNEDLQHRGVSVSILNCVSRRSSQPYPLTGEFGDRFGTEAARSDYAINGGAAEVPSGTWIELKKEGVWRLGKMTAMASIRDGLSNTYLLGEKAMNVREYETGDDFGDRAPAFGWADSQVGGNSTIRFAARTPVRDHESSCTACHDFGSAHPQVWNAAMADGSVHGIAYNIDIIVHRATASIAGHDYGYFHQKNQ